MPDDPALDLHRTAEHVRDVTDDTGADPSAGTTGPHAGVPPAALPSIPGYRISAALGQGGMGRVYAGHDLTLDREVAIKTLLPGAGAERFVTEARITARLPHPGIPPVHALGTLDDGTPFLAMKLVGGRTLAELLRDRPTPLAEQLRFVQIFEQIAQAVGFAHAQGIIHRDLKPLNVMVGAFGEVQVMDWGLAKELSRAEPAGPDLPQPAHADPDATTEHRPPVASTELRTRAGHALGTPSYMPPEQARGELERIDRRSDVFALGGILCTILTGKPPYALTGVASTIRAAAEGQLADAWSRLESSGADAELVSLCKRCLAADPADRPADGGAVAALVAAYRAGVDARLRAAERDRAAAEAKASEQRKKRRVQLALAAAVVVLLAGLGAFAWYSERQTADERDRLGRNAEAVRGLLDQAEASLRANDATRAGQLLDVADARAGEGGADELADRAGALRADWTALVALDQGDQLRWSVARGRRQTAAAAVRYRAGLGAVGADPLAVPAETVAARVHRSTVAERLLAALDWVLWEERAAAVREALRVADPDPFRMAVREADAVNDRKAVAELAARPEAAHQPARFVALLGEAGFIPGETRRNLLVDALRRQPDSFGLLITLCYANHREEKGVPANQMRFAQAAVALAPSNPIPHLEMGLALLEVGELDEAAKAFRTSMRLDPTVAYPHSNLAVVLYRKGDIEGARVELQEAVRLDPGFAGAHSNLATVLDRLGDEEGALAEFHAALRLAPDFCDAHYNYGNQLYKMGDLQVAVKEYREAIRCNPSFAPAHNNLGNPLFQLGHVQEALAELREGIRLDPKRANPHNILGTILHDLGDLAAAEGEFKETLRLDAKNTFAKRNLERVARHRPLLPRLAAVIAGTDQPKGAAEAVEFADLCRMPFQKRYATAVRLFEAAFAADAKLVVQVAAGHTRRQAAAMAAVQAGCGRGADAPTDPAARAALRAKALAWLRAALAENRQRAASASPAERKQAANELTSLLRTTEFQATQPGPQQYALPEAEQAEWHAFWSAVRSTIADARNPSPSTSTGRR